MPEQLAPIQRLQRSRALDDPDIGLAAAQELMTAVTRCIEDEIADLHYQDYLHMVDLHDREEKSGHSIEDDWQPNDRNLRKLKQLEALLTWFISPGKP